MMAKRKTESTTTALPAIPTLPFVVLTADTLIALVQRIDKLEAKVKELEDQDQSNFDILVEHIPEIVAGGLKFKATNSFGDGYEDVILPLAEVPAV